MEDYGYSGNSFEGTDYNSSGNPHNAAPSEEESPPVNNLKHMVDIMKAALPHLDDQTQESADLIIRTTELMDTLQSARSKEKVSAFSLQRQNIDLEALLSSIRNVCFSRERQIIDSILGFLRMKTMFETYSALSGMMSQSESTGNADNNTGTNTGFGSGFNPGMMELLESMLSPEQKSTFENMSMMFNMMQE